MQPECLDRLSHAKMEYYRDVYQDSERWNGIEPLAGKKVIVYCEQGYGDIIHFARYFSFLKNYDCEVVLHCPEALHRLFKSFGYEMIDRSDPHIPDHNYHIPSMSLPFNLDNPEISFPYLHVDDVTDLSEAEFPDNSVKIGIGWEGNPEHSNNSERCCPLIYFKQLTEKHPNIKMFTLHKVFHESNLIIGSEEMELYGADLDDFYDTAKLINALDFVVTVDTSVLHLAGALDKPTYGLLSYRCDPRWEIQGVNWYPSIELLKQKYEDDWGLLFEELEEKLGKNEKLLNTTN